MLASLMAPTASWAVNIIPTVADGGGVGDGGAATSVRGASPTGAVLASDGNLYVADEAHDRIGEGAAGTSTITAVAGNGTADSMARENVDPASAAVGQPNRDTHLEAARFRAMQQASDDGLVRHDGLVNALAQRSALVARFRLKAAGIAPSAWTTIGPSNIGGRIRSIVTHPTDPNLLFVGSVSGGIWKSTDAGASWAPVNDFMPNVAIDTLVRDPSNPQRMYAGTGEVAGDGIRGFGAFVSTDGGSTWPQLGGTVPDPTTQQSDFYYISRIAVHPTNSDIVLIATSGLYCNSGGVYRSTNATSVNPTWTLVYSIAARDVKFDPNNGNNVIVGEGSHCVPPTYTTYDGGAVAYSTDAGTSFTRVPLDTTTKGRVEVAWAPATSGLAVAVTEGSGGRFWASTDSGRSWALNSQTGDGADWYTNTVWVDPTDSQRIVVGGFQFYRGDGPANWWITNAAVPWTRINDWTNPASVHADDHAIVNASNYNGTSNRVVYVGTDGGLYKSADIAAHDGVNFTAYWSNLNNGLQITQFYSGAGKSGYAGGSTLVVGGSQDNGCLKAPASGLSWSNFFYGDGGVTAVDPVDPNFYYCEYINASVNRATTGGFAAPICGGPNPITEGLQDAANGCGASATNEANFIAPFVLDPNNFNTMLVGAKSLWRSLDVKAATPDWFVVKGPDPAANNYISAVAVTPGYSDMVWVGYNQGQVYCTSNGTASSPTWTKVTALSATRMVLRIMAEENRVFVTYGGYNAGNVMELTVPGQSTPSQLCQASPTVTDLSSNLPQAPVRSIVRNATNANWFYVGTDVGVFDSTDGGVSWNANDDGPGTVATDQLFWLDSATLVAATHGRGMFKATVSVASAPSVVTQAASGITTTGATLNDIVYSNGASTTVTFQYGLTTTYAAGTATAAQSPLPAGAAGQDALVSAVITGLTCNEPYHFRVVAANSAGTTNGPDQIFTTGACSVSSPTVTTNAASAIAATSATLNGTVSSNGASTTVTFQYGLTTSYAAGTATAAQSPLAAGAAGAAVSAAVSGLACNATYHFRAVGTNSIATTYGADATFTTATCATASTTTLGSNFNPSTVGATITFTATVAGAAPTGSVGFTDGGVTIGGCGGVALTGSGNARTAVCTTNALTLGGHSVTASYSGDAANQSSSVALTQTVLAALPGTCLIVANPYGALTVQGGTLSGITISNLQANAVIQLGTTAAASTYAEIDCQGFNWGTGTMLTVRSGAAGQTLAIYNTAAVASAIGGTLQAQGSNGAPAIYLANPNGFAIGPTGNVYAPSGLTLDALGNTWTTGQNIANAGWIDGGGVLTLYGANIKGGGVFKGNAAVISTFGSANNPVNGAYYLSNGLQLFPSTGSDVYLTLNDYGNAPQYFNFMVNGNAHLEMPSAWPSWVILPPNNPPVPAGGVRAAGVPDPSYGASSIIVQASGAMTLYGDVSNDFVFSGGIALKSGGTLDLSGVTVNQGWTTTGQAFQGTFFESPNIVSTGGNIQVLTNNLNWINFSTLPHAPVRTWTLMRAAGGSAQYFSADSVAPHLNTYSVLINAAAAGQCWVCLDNTQPVNMY